jgi:hypothetical protein
MTNSSSTMSLIHVVWFFTVGDCIYKTWIDYEVVKQKRKFPPVDVDSRRFGPSYETCLHIIACYAWANQLWTIVFRCAVAWGYVSFVCCESWSWPSSVLLNEFRRPCLELWDYQTDRVNEEHSFKQAVKTKWRMWKIRCEQVLDTVWKQLGFLTLFSCVNVSTKLDRSQFLCINGQWESFGLEY